MTTVAICRVILTFNRARGSWIKRTGDRYSHPFRLLSSPSSSPRESNSVSRCCQAHTDDRSAVPSFLGCPVAPLDRSRAQFSQHSLTSRPSFRFKHSCQQRISFPIHPIFFSRSFLDKHNAFRHFNRRPRCPTLRGRCPMEEARPRCEPPRPQYVSSFFFFLIKNIPAICFDIVFSIVTDRGADLDSITHSFCGRFGTARVQVLL